MVKSYDSESCPSVICPDISIYQVTTAFRFPSGSKKYGPNVHKIHSSPHFFPNGNLVIIEASCGEALVPQHGDVHVMGLDHRCAGMTQIDATEKCEKEGGEKQ